MTPETSLSLAIIQEVDHQHDRFQPIPESKTIRASELTNPFPQFVLGRMYKRKHAIDYGFPMHLGTAWDAEIKRTIERKIDAGGEFYGRPAQWGPRNGFRDFWPEDAALWTGWIQDKRFYAKLGSWTISGEPDLIYVSDAGTEIYDYKLTKVWAFDKDNEGYRWQLSLYAWLLSENGFPGPFTGTLLKFGKDFSQTQHRTPAADCPVELYPFDEVVARIAQYTGRLESLIDRPLPESFGCVPDERERYGGRLVKPRGTTIEGIVHLGSAPRCDLYCGYNHVCPLYRESKGLIGEGVA